MNKKYIIILFMVFVTSLRAQVYYFEFTNPVVAGSNITWTVNLKACSASFNFLSGNLRYNFNNSGMSTTAAITWNVTHPNLVADASGYLGTAPNRYVNAAFSTTLPVTQGLLIDQTGITVGTITHPLATTIPPSALADVLVREYNVSGYSVPAPTPTVNNSSKIFTLVSPTTPVLACTPVNGVQFAPLPLELVDFSAAAMPEFKSKLDWTTTNEVNTDYFDIERSVDGTNWLQIGQVAAAGNSTSKREYNFIDRQVPVSRQKDVVVYYRLKMTDLDGKFKYSDIRGVNFNRIINDDIEIYPNPAFDMLNVDVSGMDTENGTIELSLYDVSSKRVFNKTIIGSGIELLDISGLTGGTYHVRISQGQKTFNKNIIKLH